VYTPHGDKITSLSATDTNGNMITGTVVNSSETDWTDSVGRVALKIITGSSSVQYEFLTPTGSYQTATVTLLTLNIKTNFGCSGVSEYSGTAKVPNSLQLPNGSSYSFGYEGTPGGSGYSTGRLDTFFLPNGGDYVVEYASPNDAINCSDGTITNLQMISASGAPGGTWNLSRAQSSGNWQTTVTMPDQYNSPVYQDQALYTFNSNGHEITRLVYQGNIAGGTLERETDTTWTSNGTPQSKVIVLEDSTTASEADTTYNSNGILQQIVERDWGTKTTPGPVLRTTNFSYLSGVGQIIDRVTSMTVTDQTSTVQYREDTTYDDSSYVNSPCITGASQHDDTNYGCAFTARGLPTTVTTYAVPSTMSGSVTKTATYDSLAWIIHDFAGGKRKGALKD
jgi:hypothetical protein